MAIRGLTHDLDGTIVANETWRGKISVGYAAGEGPEKLNRPSPAKHFRVLRQENSLVHGQTITNWKENVEMQGLLARDPLNVKTPKLPCIIEFVSMYRTPDELWNSYLGKFGTSGLQCRSHGEGTKASMLVVEGETRHFEDRCFDTPKGRVDYCIGDKCPDYISEDCCAHGQLKVFPKFDISTSPYRFDTTSINTIIQVEAMLDRVWNLLQTSHAIRVKLTPPGEPEPVFTGLMGTQWFLQHKATISGGKRCFVTELKPGKSLMEFIMMPIRGELAQVQASQLKGKVAVIGQATNAAQLGYDNPMSDDGPSVNDTIGIHAEDVTMIEDTTTTGDAIETLQEPPVSEPVLEPVDESNELDNAGAALLAEMSMDK